MSLIHWWPLNGNTRDKITNTQLTNNGATIVNDGKIGQCYTFNGSTNLTMPYPSLNALGSNPTQFSFAFWIKLNSTWTGWGQVFTIGRNGGNWEDIRIGFDIATDKTGYFAISDGSTSTRYNGPKHVLTIDEWHHIAATFDNKEMKLFVDGQPASTPQVTASILPSFSNDTIIAIGGNNGEKGECDMNDVRIYDHVLSAMEIKELSKALVLHYTFDDVLAEDTINLLPANLQNKSVIGTTNDAAFFKHKVVDAGGFYTVTADICREIDDKRPNPYFSLHFSQADKNATTDAEIIASGMVHGGVGTTIATDGVDIAAAADGKFHTYTLTLDTTKATKPINWVCGWLLDRGTYANQYRNEKIKNAQLEHHDHTTPYTPNNRDGILRNEAGYIVADTVQNLQLSTDAAIGKFSAEYNGNTYITHTSAGDISAGASASLWLKNLVSINNLGKSDGWVAFADSNSELGFGIYTNTEGVPYGVIGVGSNGINKPSVSNSSLIKLWKDCDWNHVVVVRPKTGNFQCYINGQECSYGTNDYWTHDAAGGLTLGTRRAGGYSRLFKGLMDDFRLYHTALIEDDENNIHDITDLYNCGGAISDQGDVLTGCFIGGASEIQVRKNHTIESKDLYEQLNDKYEILDSLEFNKNEYIDTEIIFNDIETPIYIKADVTPKGVSGNNCLAGCGNSMWSGPVMLNFCAGQLEFGVNGYKKESSCAIDERMTIVAKIRTKAGEHEWYKNDTCLTFNSANNARTATSTSLYIGAFHYDNSTTSAADGWKGLIHYFQVKYGNIHKVFLPAREISSNDIGLLDILNNKFHKNISGSGNFVAGNVVANNEATFYKTQNVSGRNIIEI